MDNLGFTHKGRAAPRKFPEGAYVTVRALADGWAAIVALHGEVRASAMLPDRAAAFDTAIRKATHEGLPCLVERVGPYRAAEVREACE